MCRPNFRAMRSLQVRRRRTDVVHRAEVDRMQSLPTTDQTPTRTERAILAGGCFWGLEDLLRRAKGVVTTRVGYIGGEMPDPT